MECPKCQSKSIELIKCYDNIEKDVFKCLVCFYVFNSKSSKIIKKTKLDKFIKMKVK